MSLIYSEITPTNIFTNILLIDRRVRDYQQFVNSANSTTFPIVYSTNSSKTELLTLLQTNFTAIKRIGLCFTDLGNSSQLFLDSKSFFSNNEVDPYSENLQFIINIIKQFGVTNLDYLACNTLQSPSWVNYYKILTDATGVIVGASNDKTGNIKYGGDWIMESTSQDIEFIYFTSSIEYYKYLLDIAQSTMVIKNDGTVWGTGNNDFNSTTLVQVTIPVGKTVATYAQGESHTIILMTDGTVWGFGYNGYGQLGNPAAGGSTLVQMLNTTGKTPAAIACGGFHTIVLMTDGSVWGTGSNDGDMSGSGLDSGGVLGTGNYTTYTTLVQMPLPSGKTAAAIAGGLFHTIVLMADGSVWGTGENIYSQLGQANTNYTTLVQIPNSTGQTVASIYCGERSTMVLMTNYTVWGGWI